MLGQRALASQPRAGLRSGGQAFRSRVVRVCAAKGFGALKQKLTPKDYFQ